MQPTNHQGRPEISEKQPKPNRQCGTGQGKFALGLLSGNFAVMFLTPSKTQNAPSVSLGLVENGIRAVSPCMPLSLDTATKNQVASAVIGRTIVTPTATDTKLCVQPNSQGVVVETEENLEAENHRLILASFTLEDNSLLPIRLTLAKQTQAHRRF